LVWRDDDRARGRTALYRSEGGVAAPDVPDGTLVLTREQLRVSPPDVLFLSLEMLNQNMGNPAWTRAFGFEPMGRKPRLLLLDEVHMYEGIPGAAPHPCERARARTGRGLQCRVLRSEGVRLHG